MWWGKDAMEAEIEHRAFVRAACGLAPCGRGILSGPRYEIPFTVHGRADAARPPRRGPDTPRELSEL